MPYGSDRGTLKRVTVKCQTADCIDVLEYQDSYFARFVTEDDKMTSYSFFCCGELANPERMGRAIEHAIRASGGKDELF